MSTVLTRIDNNTYAYDKRLHVKGAAEMVLANWSHYINAGGEAIELSEQMKEYQIKNAIEKFAKGALRKICLAYKDLRPNEGGLTHENDAEDGANKVVEKNGLTCIGILGISYIIRPEVPEAVATYQKAGIKVRMVTGDNKITALAKGKEWGILSEDVPDIVFYLANLLWESWRSILQKLEPKESMTMTR